MPRGQTNARVGGSAGAQRADQTVEAETGRNCECPEARPTLEVGQRELSETRPELAEVSSALAPVWPAKPQQVICKMIAGEESKAAELKILQGCQRHHWRVLLDIKQLVHFLGGEYGRCRPRRATAGQECDSRDVDAHLGHPHHCSLLPEACVLCSTDGGACHKQQG